MERSRGANYLFYYANELYDQKKKGKAFALYCGAAELGDPRAFFWVGYSYELGEGVPRDASRAAQYYRQALTAPIQEKVNPANRLGMFYYDGNGVEPGYSKAFHLLKWAEDKNGPVMFYYLGPATPTAMEPSRTTPKSSAIWSRSTGTARMAFTYWASCTATVRASRRTLPRAWNASGSPATMSTPGRH